MSQQNLNIVNQRNMQPGPISGDMRHYLRRVESLLELLPDEKIGDVTIVMDGLYDCHARIAGLENAAFVGAPEVGGAA